MRQTLLQQPRRPEQHPQPPDPSRRKIPGPFHPLTADTRLQRADAAQPHNLTVAQPLAHLILQRRQHPDNIRARQRTVPADPFRHLLQSQFTPGPGLRIIQSLSVFLTRKHLGHQRVRHRRPLIFSVLKIHLINKLGYKKRGRDRTTPAPNLLYTYPRQ